MTPKLGHLKARELLAKLFWDDLIIVDLCFKRIIEETRTLPLQEYADNLCSCYEALASIDALTHLDNSKTLPKLVDKLHGYLQSQWRSLALNLRKESPPRRPALVDLAFVQDTALEANDPLQHQGKDDSTATHGKGDQPHYRHRSDHPVTIILGTVKAPEYAVCKGKHAAIKCVMLCRIGPDNCMIKARVLRLLCVPQTGEQLLQMSH